MNETLGFRLRKLRNEKGVFQKDVAKILNLTDVGYGYYEKDEREPNNETLKKLAEYFKVSTDYLLGKADKREKDILDQPLQIAASMKDKTADLSNLSEGDKEVVRQMIRSLNEKNKK